MTTKEFIKRWRPYVGTKDQEMERDLNELCNYKKRNNIAKWILALYFGAVFWFSIFMLLKLLN